MQPGTLLCYQREDQSHIPGRVLKRLAAPLGVGVQNLNSPGFPWQPSQSNGARCGFGGGRDGPGILRSTTALFYVPRCLTVFGIGLNTNQWPKGKSICFSRGLEQVVHQMQSLLGAGKASREVLSLLLYGQQPLLLPNHSPIQPGDGRAGPCGAGSSFPGWDFRAGICFQRVGIGGTRKAFLAV